MTASWLHPSTKRIVHEGEDISIVDLAKRLDMNKQVLHWRYKRGDRGARLVRPVHNGYQGRVTQPPAPPVADPAMQRLIDRWNAAVFGEEAAA